MVRRCCLLLIALSFIVTFLKSQQCFSWIMLRNYYFRSWRHCPIISSSSSSSSSCPSLSPLLAWRRNKHKSNTSNNNPNAAKDELSWEHFDFGDSPKWDRRFETSTTTTLSPTTLSSSSSSNIMNNNNKTTTTNKEYELRKLQQLEEQEDHQAAKTLQSSQEAWKRLDPNIVHQATNILLPYVNQQRIQRITTVLQSRTKYVRFLFENPMNPSNVWACLRTIDSFGIQYVDVIISSGKYIGKAAITQKRGMRTAMGSAQWLTIRNHFSTSQAIQTLRQEGYRIYASDVNPTSIDIRDIDWSKQHSNQQSTTETTSTSSSLSSITSSSTTTTSTYNEFNHGSHHDNDDDNDDDDRPICIVMGNEETGISDEMKINADVTFTLPMSGFAESFNLSVATAITLAHLSAASSSSPNNNNNNNNDNIKKKKKYKGPLRPGDLLPDEYDTLFLKGILNSISKKAMATALLKREGIELPSDIREV